MRERIPASSTSAPAVREPGSTSARPSSPRSPASTSSKCLTRALSPYTRTCSRAASTCSTTIRPPPVPTSSPGRSRRWRCRAASVRRACRSCPRLSKPAWSTWKWRPGSACLRRRAHPARLSNACAPRWTVQRVRPKCVRAWRWAAAGACASHPPRPRRSCARRWSNGRGCFAGRESSPSERMPDLEDQLAISALMQDWALARDTGDWDAGRATAHPRMSINLRSRLDGVEVDAVCSGRFFDRVEKRGGVWRIARRSVIYEKDRIDPVDPNARISLDARLLARFPEGYRHLAYLQTKNGARVNPNLPTARGEALEKLLAEAKAWLGA